MSICRRCESRFQASTVHRLYCRACATRRCALRGCPRRVERPWKQYCGREHADAAKRRAGPVDCAAGCGRLLVRSPWTLRRNRGVAVCPECLPAWFARRRKRRCAACGEPVSHRSRNLCGACARNAPRTRDESERVREVMSRLGPTATVAAIARAAGVTRQTVYNVRRAAPVTAGCSEPSNAAYSAHLRRGEKPCGGCRAAATEYQRSLRARHRMGIRRQRPSCGTVGGYDAHWRRHEPACRACRQAKAGRSADNRARGRRAA